MTTSVQSAVFSGFAQTLHALSAILDKASAHAAARKIKPEVLLAGRLTPDMLPLSRQIQLCCDFAKNAAVRVGGVENVRFPDEETSFEELKARIAATLAFAGKIDPDAFAAGLEKDVSFPRGGQEHVMKGSAYLSLFAVPNFYFHAATAYALLRKDGIEIGKRDFLNDLKG